jgi:hypothetical protein
VVEFAVMEVLALLDDTDDFVRELAPAELLLGAAPDDEDDVMTVDGEEDDRDNERERAFARRF